MTSIVCIVCDTAKPLADRVTDRDFCGVCDKATGNRSVGDDTETIAPWSTLTYAEQRALYGQARRDRV